LTLFLWGSDLVAFAFLNFFSSFNPSLALGTLFSTHCLLIPSTHPLFYTIKIDTMQLTTPLVLFAASLAAAQTTTNAPPTSTGKSCAAQNILDTCKEGIQKQIDTCKGNDWMCLCDNYTNLLTCYNNCPDDLGKSPVQNQVTQFCAAAAP
jgi:hypothetical protein